MYYDYIVFGEEKIKHSKEISIIYERIHGYYFTYKDEKGCNVARWMAADKYGAARVLNSFADKYLKTTDWWEMLLLRLRCSRSVSVGR